MKRRIVWILVIGGVTAVLLVAVTDWLLWHYRYVTNAELQAEATREYERKNAANLAMQRGPAWRLSELDEKYQSAAKAIASALVGQNEDPSKFRVKVFEQKEGATFIFSLQHIDDYLPANGGKIGNPSGRDRMIEYDVRAAKVGRTLFYQ